MLARQFVVSLEVVCILKLLQNIVVDVLFLDGDFRFKDLAQRVRVFDMPHGNQLIPQGFVAALNDKHLGIWVIGVFFHIFYLIEEYHVVGYELVLGLGLGFYFVIVITLFFFILKVLVDLVQFFLCKGSNLDGLNIDGLEYYLPRQIEPIPKSVLSFSLDHLFQPNKDLVKLHWDLSLFIGCNLRSKLLVVLHVLQVIVLSADAIYQTRNSVSKIQVKLLHFLFIWNRDFLLLFLA